MSSTDLPLKDVPKPTTAYLDDSEPLLKIPIWRGCAAAHDSVNSAWLPAVEEGMKIKDKQQEESHSAEEEKAMSQAFKEGMMDIPWVKAAARAAKRQEKAKNKNMKKKATGEKKVEQV
jgi:Cu/Ag efflux pump CusA